MSNHFYQHHPFPSGSFPPILRDAMYDIFNLTQAPLLLIANSILGGISTVCQQHIDVERNGIRSPVSLYIITVAESGERKSTVDALVMKPIYAFNRKLRRAHESDRNKFKNAHRLWKIKRKNLERALDRAISKGESGEAEEEVLLFHLEMEPPIPSQRKLILADATPPSLKSALAGNGASTSIMADEGGVVFDGHLFQNLPLLTSLYSGMGELPVDRKTGESFVIYDARVSMYLPVQPVVLQNYMKKHGERAIGSGLFPRCLIAFPQSTQGYRNILEVESLPSASGLGRFNQRMEELLELPEERDDGNIKRRVLRFIPEAARHWIDIARCIENDLAPGQPLHVVRAFASRFGENIARMAALFHFFSGDEGDIPLETLRQAEAIGFWYAKETLRLFGNWQLPEHIADANRLLPWLQKRFHSNGGKPIRKNILYQRGPYSIRSKDRMNAALNHLISSGDVWIQKWKNALHLYPRPFLSGSPWPVPWPPQAYPMQSLFSQPIPQLVSQPCSPALPCSTSSSMEEIVHDDDEAITVSLHLSELDVVKEHLAERARLAFGSD